MNFGIRPLICLTLLTTAYPATPAELGRLFFTPEQRKQLEHRQQDSAPASSTVTVNGVVQKASGGRTVWINGVPQTGSDSHKHAPDGASITVPGQTQAVEVKVGQKLTLPPAEP